MRSSQHSMENLRCIADFYLEKSLAPSTRLNYDRVFNEFCTFCQQSDVPIFPVTEDTLRCYVSFLSRRVSYNTIKGYLCAIRFHALCLGQPFRFNNMDLLYYTLRGIKRLQGEQFSRPRRSPITVMHLRKIFTFLRSSQLNSHDRLMYWATCTLAFFGLLRVSEYACPRIRAYDQRLNLMYSDIMMNTQFMAIFIKGSKTDPFRQGCRITVGRTNNYLCPVSAMNIYLRYRGVLNGPLFIFSDGSFLTRARFAAFINSVFNNPLLNTHSFRIGGASALSASGVSDAQIKIIGRWNSDCFIRYIRLDSRFVSSLAVKMVSESKE